MSRGRGPVLTLCLVQFVDVLGVTVVITALPSMLAGLGAPASAATPVVTSYAMCFGGLLMLGSRVGDRYGHRRVLVAGLVLFGAGSLLAATASSLAWLVIARCIQGVSAAGSVPAALRLLSASADGEDARRRALAAWSATGAVAGASGLLLGGVLTQLAGWQLMFWLNLPLAAVLVLAVLRTVAPSAAVPGRLDVGGAVLLTGAVMGLVLGCALLENAGRRLVGVALVGAGLLLLAAFRSVERRVAVPLLPAAAVGNRRLRLGSGAGFVNTAATSSAVTLATLYLQDTHGASPAEAGVALLPFSILVVVASATTAAPLMRRIGPVGTVRAGLVLIGAGDVALLSVSISAWLLPVAVGIAGFGIGLSSVAATTIGTDVPDALAATAAGALNTAAQLGTALGVAAITLVAASTSGLALGGDRLGWLCAGAFAIASAAAVRARAPHRSADVEPQPAEGGDRAGAGAPDGSGRVEATPS